MGYISIDGTPAARFEFISVPSWNTAYSHWKKKAEAVRSLRKEACVVGQVFMRSLGLPALSRPLVDRAMIIVSVYTQHEGVMDIHNVNVKPILDGLVDAGVITDDDWAFLPVVIFRWAGVDDNKQRRTVVEVYSLEALIINDESQVLPLGRRRVV